MEAHRPESEESWQNRQFDEQREAMFNSWQKDEHIKHKKCEPHRWSYADPKHCLDCGKPFEMKNKYMTVVEKIFEDIRTYLPIDNAFRMQMESDVQIWLQKEQDQLNKAWQEGALEAQSDACKEIQKNYTPRK